MPGQVQEHPGLHRQPHNGAVQQPECCLVDCCVVMSLCKSRRLVCISLGQGMKADKAGVLEHSPCCELELPCSEMCTEAQLWSEVCRESKHQMAERVLRLGDRVRCNFCSGENMAMRGCGEMCLRSMSSTTLNIKLASRWDRSVWS